MSILAKMSDPTTACKPHMSGSRTLVKPPFLVDGCETVTQDSLHHGRITYLQFEKGYRTGLEPVLLAAFVPARRGDAVLEAGCGAGAGLLCLNARVAGLHLAGLEADPTTVELAQQNLLLNTVENCTIFSASIPEVPITLRKACHNANGRFHHGFANPPWHPHNATLAQDPRRRRALFCDQNGWGQWIATLTKWIMPGGTLSLALPATALSEALTHLDRAGFGSATLLPLWPKSGRRAKIILLQAVSGGRGGTVVSSGLTIHEEDGSFTRAARHVLLDGRPLLP